MPDDPPRGLPRNQILAALPAKEIKRLQPRLERVVFRSNDIVYRPGEAAGYVYFPEDAVISLVANLADGRSVEVNLTGNEGLLGMRVVLGAKNYWYTALAQIPGSCLRVDAETFKAEFRRGGALQLQTLHYLRYLLVQVSENAACNRVHRVKQRLARRLLMIQDRVQKDEFPMTHESISYMLGTPRSEVSLAAEALRRSGIINYARGKVTILNRRELESASCECYQVIHKEFLSLG